MSDEQLERIKVKCHELLTGLESEETKEAAAIISIIAQIGLRPGSVAGFEKTENRGVSTLTPENFKIHNSHITLDFIGKSFKHNTAEIEDGVLAYYLEERIKTKEPKKFLFGVSKDIIERFYKKTLEMGDFKIKDLRTFIANKIAKEFLENDPEMPPPVPVDPTEIKKVVKKKLHRAFEVVSKKLNNSPAMAKSSYVDPSIIESWLEELGIEEPKHEMAEVVESESSDNQKFIGNAPVYDLPHWWNSDIELVKSE